MTEPLENIKLFDIRPVAAVAGLVPGGQHCGPVLQALPAQLERDGIQAFDDAWDRLLNHLRRSMYGHR
jgi:hypothetical protein